MTNTLHQWLFGNKKKLLTQGNHFGFRRPPPFHPCVLERGCRKHNTNGSGITLNIQMGKLIVYAWIHRCDYLAPLASLLRSLKATPSAFCFHLPPLKKKKKKVSTTRRDSDAEVQRREFISINVFLLFFFFCCLLRYQPVIAVQGAEQFLWQTPSARSESQMTKEEDGFAT